MAEVQKKPVIILLAEDDEDDYFLTLKAMQHTRVLNELRWVRDGQELMDYLQQKGDYLGKPTLVPGIILLDLNMPRKNGMQALQEIKSDPRLRCIPVVIMTTSQSEEDIIRSYHLGVNSFIKKPVDFHQFIKVMQSVSSYWIEIVELPPERATRQNGAPAPS